MNLNTNLPLALREHPTLLCRIPLPNLRLEGFSLYSIPVTNKEHDNNGYRQGLTGYIDYIAYDQLTNRFSSFKSL